MRFGAALAHYRRVDWNDFRYLLAIARAGSALRAARALGVNQTTVLRRVDALEAATGARLIERRRSGNTLTPIGRLAAETAERIERETQGFVDSLATARRARALRLTASDILADRLVAPCLREFRSRHPNVTIELIMTDERLDVARGDADMALRAGSRPEGAGIVARRLPDVEWAVYCSAAYAAERGRPERREQVRGRDVVGLDGRLAALPAAAWLAQAAAGGVTPCRSNSLVTLLSNVKAGLGLGALPALAADLEPALVRCLDVPAECRSELWLIVREQMKSRPHIRAFADFLASYVRRELSAAPARAPEIASP